jgi:tungstate transport system permease protein
LGAALAVYSFPGRRILIVAFNALLGLPPVVVGLALYLLLSRSGPLGTLSLLFTPGAMVLAQTVMALPIVTALVHSASVDLWAE